MTAFAVEHLIEEAIAEGVFAVLRKPFDIDRAIPMLLRAIGHPLVLVVDDEPNQAETAAAALCAGGVRAKAVFDGASAVREVSGGNIDVCVVDLVMPGLDGSEVVRQIAAIDPAVVCIAISGHDVPELIRRVVAAGAFACMRKPVPIPELTRTIAKARAKAVQ
jgi:CheY-like chemotaxis protein